MKIKIYFIICLLSFLSAKGIADQQELLRIRRAIAEEGADWVADITSISQLAPEERTNLCGLILSAEMRERKDLDMSVQLDSMFDWRDRDQENWMTEVKDQGQCGSCWAFGALGAFEAAIKIYYDAPDIDVDLSEQHMVCCCHPSQRGCSGYTLDGTVNWLRDRGVPDEACFPYVARDSGSGVYCSDKCVDWDYRLRKITDWRWVPLGDSTKYALLDAPLYVGMAVYSDFFSYRSGVYEHVYGDLEGYHAVALLGWSDSSRSWICKNSWGRDWGEDGWFQIRWGDCLWDPAIAMTPAELEHPQLVCLSTQVEEDPQYGDGDEVLNPSERAALTVALQNLGDSATGVVGVLRSQDCRVVITDSIAVYGDLPSRAVCLNPNPFTLIVPDQVGPFPLTLCLRAGDPPDTAYSTTLDLEVEVTLNQREWPIPAGVTESSPALADIDDDGRLEIITGSNDGNLYVKTPLGMDKPGYPFFIGGRLAGSPAVGDVNGDRSSEIVIGSWDGDLYLIQSSGALLRKIETDDRFTATPALSDIDTDGALDIVIGDLSGDLHLFHNDGSEFPGFPYATGAPILNGAAVGDIDGDGSKDIIVGNALGIVYALSGEGNLLWDFSTGGCIRSEPSLAELDGLRILIGSLDNNLYVLDGYGGEITRVSTGNAVRTSPAFADLDGDGDLDIVFTSGSDIHACNQDGQELNGWPKSLDGDGQSPSFFDLDADGYPEVVVPTSAGMVYALRKDGSPLQPFPFSTGSRVQSSPAIADLDLDGDPEIVFGDNSSLVAIDVKSAQGDSRYWNMHRGNPRRTGDYRDLLTCVHESSFWEPPVVWSLHQNYPNPFSPVTTIVYSLPEECRVNLSIFNLLGERVKTLVDRTESIGQKIVTWNGRDDGNLRVPAGVYFYRIEASGFVATRKMVVTF